jgi:hypothetical protein
MLYSLGVSQINLLVSHLSAHPYVYLSSNDAVLPVLMMACITPLSAVIIIHATAV